MSTIGMITTSYPLRADDPSGRFVHEMAWAFAEHGHRVEVIAPEPAETPAPTPGGSPVAVYYAPYVRPRQKARLFYENGVLDNLRLRPRNALLVAPAVASLQRVARRRARNWDALVSHWLLPSGWIAGSLRRSGIMGEDARHLAIAHSGDVHLLGRLPLRAWLAHHLLGGADHLGFISEDLHGRFEAILPRRALGEFERRAVITPMGTSVIPSSTVRHKPVSLLFVGRLVPVKGVDLLLQALSELPDCRVTIAGDGSERAALEQLVGALGVSATFVGRVTPQERNRLLAECDIVVVPSRILQSGRTEGLPLAVVEGMATGKAVVASDVGGIAELLVHQKNGWLVPPGDVSALRGALSALIQDAALSERLGCAAARAVSGRRWSELTARYLQMLGLESQRDMG